MKKTGIFAVILALSLVLTGCMTGGMIPPPETLADGTPWNTEGSTWRAGSAWSGPRASIC